MKKTTAAKRIDTEIEAIFYRRCCNIEISVMDLGKIYAAGRAAHAAGLDVEAAVVASVQSLRKN